MKTKLSYLKQVGVALLLFTTACQSDAEFLNLNSPTAISATNYYKTPEEITAAVTGAYGGLRGYYQRFFALTEMPSDNTISVLGSDGTIGQYYRLTWTVTDAEVSSRWSQSYNLIFRCNNVLERINSVTFPDNNVRDRMAGEMKFIRALMYFNLVQLFGDVPLVLKVIQSEEEAYTFLREPKAAVYQQIEKDLTEAEAVLPARYTAPNVGRVTKGAAKSLLGKVYLTQHKWQQAETKLKEVIEGRSESGYQLLTNYADVFREDNGNNAEIVFSIQYTNNSNGEGSNFTLDFIPSLSGTQIVPTGQGGNNNLGSTDLFNAFEPNDKRKAVSIDKFVSGGTFYYTRKWFTSRPLAIANDGNADWPVIRYSDVLLMYGEALNENGKTTDALRLGLEPVRTRAGLTTSLTLTQAQARLAFENERRIELCFESHRWFDLIRTNRMVPVLSAFRDANLDGSNKEIQVADYKKLFPIPLNQIQLNPKLTQNPGYQ